MTFCFFYLFLISKIERLAIIFSRSEFRSFFDQPDPLRGYNKIYLPPGHHGGRISPKWAAYGVR